MGTVTPIDQIRRFEVTEVYAHPEATVDIVLVHGLNGHPVNTWTAENGVFWPTDLLPVTLREAKARILVYGYNADVYTFGGDDTIHQHAQSLLTGLSMERMSEEMDENSIIWVAHSLGGILVKRALELSSDLTSKSSDPSRSIYVSTFGIIFLGTPHLGADSTKWAKVLQSLVKTVMPKKGVETEDQLFRTLQKNNETLQNINLHFLDIYQRFEILIVHEALETDFKGTNSFVVDQASASPLLSGIRYYGIETTHSLMCKFESTHAPGYLNVSTTIKVWVNQCTPTIQTRWAAERSARTLAKENESKELLADFETDNNLNASQFQGLGVSNFSFDSPKPLAMPKANLAQSVKSIYMPKANPAQSAKSIYPNSTAAPTPYFIKPRGFRPNSFFVGREDELQKMHHMLFDRKRRAVGVAAVLLQSIPGGGKTHIAREYVYKHLHDFPGGVFWVTATSKEQLEAGFWQIASTVALKPPVYGVVTKEMDDSVKRVIDWFSTRHDWLLVLDGVHFDHTKELRKYIPDSTYSSLLYTSTQHSAGGDRHFMNPEVIRVPLLSARGAQELFLKELGVRDPTTEDLGEAMRLVQCMGFLPQVIHVAAMQLNATREPLAKFARNYASGPKLRALDLYVAAVNQLRNMHADQALNLINILAFFSSSIPVEMISLGLKAINTPVKAYAPSNGYSLNNTLKILNSYALISCTERDMYPDSSTGSKASTHLVGDDPDVILIHRTVRNFFVDSLQAVGTRSEWLTRSIDVFIRSYEQSSIRIQSKIYPGLISDYYSYEIHAVCLLTYLTEVELRGPALPLLRETLEAILRDIRAKIYRRTHELPQDTAKSGDFMQSIFDSTMSSPDIEPETPEPTDSSSDGLSRSDKAPNVKIAPIIPSASNASSTAPLIESSLKENVPFNQQTANYYQLTNDYLKEQYDAIKTYEFNISCVKELSSHVLKAEKSLTDGHPEIARKHFNKARIVIDTINSKSKSETLSKNLSDLIREQYYNSWTGLVKCEFAIMDQVTHQLSSEQKSKYLNRAKYYADGACMGRGVANPTECTSCEAHMLVKKRGQSAAGVAVKKISKSPSGPGKSGGHIQDRGRSSERPSELLANADGAVLFQPDDAHLESASQGMTINSSDPMTASAAQTLDGSLENALIQAPTSTDDGLPPLQCEGSDKGIEPRVQPLVLISDSGHTSMPFPAAPITTDDISQASIQDNQDIKQPASSSNDRGDNQTPGNDHRVEDWGPGATDGVVQSIVSDRGEIFSQVAARRTHQEILAERHLTILLAQNEELTPLYDIALERMEKEHFVDNFRKILKQYYLDLVQSANTNLEKAAVHLLRSRWSRVRIAQNIVVRASPRTNVVDAEPSGDMQEAENKIRELEDWIAGNPGLAPLPESQDITGEVDNSDGAASDSDWEEEGNSRGYPLPNVSEMEKFLLQGNSFRSLITNTCLFVLPAPLASLTRVLMTIPYHKVYFSSEDNASVLNRVKGFVEDHTEENWNWWPLQPRMRRLAEDQMRVHWTCHCGRNQWAEISQSQAESYRLILQRNKSTFWNNHLCRPRRKTSWRATFKGLIAMIAGPISSSTEKSGTQGITQPVRPQNVQLGPSGGRVQQSSYPPHDPAGPATNNQNGVQVNISGLHGAGLYVLFGVKGPRRTLELEQIKIKERSNDNVFFQSLKQSYKIRRGFWRYWFSIWQLAYCDFVKFKKIRANRIIHHSKSLPEDIIYEYAPRPPAAEIPPILPHEFELAFSACPSKCSFSALHDCVEPPIGTFAIERIPKRKGLIEIKGDNPEFVWGIEAQHVISFFRMVFYHVLILAGTFAFWAWWIVAHPDDLQNAAVPLTTAGVLLSLFWSSAGLLKAFREPH